MVKKILFGTLTTLLSLVVLFNLYTMASRALTGTQYPTVFGVGSATVVSGSMEPAIHVNDMVVTIPVRNIQKNDIVTVRGMNFTTTHRVVKVDKNTITTKGDANNVTDTPITKKVVVGKVAFVIPKIGYVGRFLGTPVGIFLLTIFLVGMWAEEDVLNWIQSRGVKRLGKQVATDEQE
jgi:signal peptidase